jgi:hypothetical protein
MNCQGSARLRHSLVTCTYLLQEVPSADLRTPDLESLYPIELYDRLSVVPEVLTIAFRNTAVTRVSASEALYVLESRLSGISAFRGSEYVRPYRAFRALSQPSIA